MPRLTIDMGGGLNFKMAARVALNAIMGTDATSATIVRGDYVGPVVGNGTFTYAEDGAFYRVVSADGSVIDAGAVFPGMMGALPGSEKK
jgi:hypothetical protein